MDISPLRRVNSAIYLISTGAREASFRNIKTIAECLADELINAAKGSSNRCLPSSLMCCVYTVMPEPCNSDCCSLLPSVLALQDSVRHVLQTEDALCPYTMRDVTVFAADFRCPGVSVEVLMFAWHTCSQYTRRVRLSWCDFNVLHTMQHWWLDAVLCNRM